MFVRVQNKTIVENINLFKDFIPNHYDEIYSLFSLLKDAAVDYHNIDFDKHKKKDEIRSCKLISCCI